MVSDVPAKILPLTNIIAQLACNKAVLQQTVKLHAHFIASVFRCAVKVALVTQYHKGVLGKMIYGSCHFRIDERHVTVRCGVKHVIFVFFQIPFQCLDQRFVEILSPLLTGDQIPKVGAKTLQSFRVKLRLAFANGKHGDALYVFCTALGVGIKISHGVQLIAKEFSPKRHVGGGGVDIQNATAESILTGTFHHAATAVAGIVQPGEKIFQNIFFAYRKGKSSAGQNLFWHGALAECFPAHDLHLGIAH